MTFIDRIPNLLINKTGKVLGLLAISLTLIACGGADTESLAADGDTQTSAQAFCAGTPDNEDVAAFQANMCTPMAIENACVGCHGVDQPPTFLLLTDVNEAYRLIQNYVDLENPAQSTLVSRVSDGHFCWLGEGQTQACAGAMTNYIERWARAASGNDNSQTLVELRPPEILEIEDSKTFPEAADGFADIHNTVTTYCSDCHVPGNQAPFFASPNIDEAYDAAQSKIDLLIPENSQFVRRLQNGHQCWGGSCADAAAEMLALIEAFSGSIELESVDPDLVTSKALNLANNGIALNVDGRFEEQAIATYEFRTGTGNIALDTAPSAPSVHLTLSGNVEWVSGWGLRFGDELRENGSIVERAGKAQGSTEASTKLHRELTLAGEYSIEAWLIPDNVTQEDARIVSYSKSADSRNFSLSQNEYTYGGLHRGETSDQNMAISTVGEALQATLQHVVMTYTVTEGRRIYVNGELIDLDQNDDGGSFAQEWANDMVLVLGNETDRESLWKGVIRFLSIHRSALTAEQIAQNYNSGVGEQFYLLFSVSDLVEVDDAFIVFEASQIDEEGYLLTTPFFLTLDADADIPDIDLEGIRVGINGQVEGVYGQSFENVSVTINSDDYVVGEGQTISSLGAVIGKQKGVAEDIFFLSFERIGEHENVFVNTRAASAASVEDAAVAAANYGIKTFEELNASMASLTGIPMTNADVVETYEAIRQQLPSTTKIDSFLTSHQMAITQLAIQYCDRLVEEDSARNAFFNNAVFPSNSNFAFDTQAELDAVTGPIIEKLVGQNLDSEPAQAALATELEGLIGELNSCSSTSSCADGRTNTIIKSTCAAVLGSAITLIQ